MFGFAARLVGGALSPLVDRISAFGASLLRKLALFLVAAVCLIVVAIALTMAFAFWISSLAGPIAGALAVAGLYLVVALVAGLLALRDGRGEHGAQEDERERQDENKGPAIGPQIDQFTGPILAMLQSLGLRREQIAVLAGASLAKQLGPVPLVGLAIVAGFLVGRLWKGWDSILTSDIVETVLDLVVPGRQTPRSHADDPASGDDAARPREAA